jgi:hypothetical protein
MNIRVLMVFFSKRLSFLLIRFAALENTCSLGTLVAAIYIKSNVIFINIENDFCIKK